MLKAGGALMVLGGLLIVAGCADREMQAAERTPSVVDSAIPIPVALERFRQKLPQPPALRGGYPSREALVRGFVQALESRDTTALRRMVLDRAEFAWLYYPSSPFPQPPYELPPDLLWFQLQGQSERGASLLLEGRAGGPFKYVDHTCAPARVESPNRIYGHCALRRVTAARDTVSEQLFGLVIEREGMFKFVSYANQLD